MGEDIEVEAYVLTCKECREELDNETKKLMITTEKIINCLLQKKLKK